MAALNSRRGWAKRQREPGVWELRVYAGVDPHTGKKRWISRTFRGGTREASKALAALATEIDGGDHRHDARTVNELFDAWLVHLEARGRAPATPHGYRNKIDKHQLPGMSRPAEKDTKTHASGPIPAADTLFELLEAHHDWQRSVAAQADVILAADGFVFADLVSDITGRCPWRPDRATEAMDRLRKRPAVKDQPGAARITVKSLRHYAATVTTSKVGLDVAKRRLRHRHITTTMRYTAAVESRDKAAAKALAPCSQAAVAEGIP